MMEALPDRPVILFDGVCNLCNHSVQFILRHDRKNKFLFAPLQGKIAQFWLTHLQYNRKEEPSIILIQNGKLYQRSTAALRIAGHLGGPIRLLYAFLIIPRFIRDGVYKWIANNRYRWFGKKDACMVPSPELKSRFITD